MIYYNVCLHPYYPQMKINNYLDDYSYKSNLSFDWVENNLSQSKNKCK